MDKDVGNDVYSNGLSRLKMAFDSQAPTPPKMKISLKESFITSNFPFKGLFCVSHTSL